MPEKLTQEQLEVKAIELAKLIKNGVIYLKGDLGAGKTTFSKAFINYLLPSVQVTSPTYPIIQEYPYDEGIIYHIDLYRLNHELEVEELSLNSLVDKKSIMLIEWPEQGGSFVPKADYTIEISHISSSHRGYKKVP